MLELSEIDKYIINVMLSFGSRVIVPSRYLYYDYDTGVWDDYAYEYGSEGRSAYFCVDPLDNGLWFGGGLDWHSSPMSWYSLTPLNQWPAQWQYLFRQGYEVAVSPEILAPADSEVYFKSDTIDFRVQWIMTYGGGVETWIDEYKINCGDHPPGMHTFKAEGWNPEEPVYDSVSLCIFDFYIREAYVKKYFNPLKPDSTRVVYQVLPMDYADPDVPPNPLAFQVEIKDKDENLVYGPRLLTYQEQKNQVLWWDGKNNSGELVNMENGPYIVRLDLAYGNLREPQVISAITETNPIEFDLVVAGVNEAKEEVIGAFIGLNKDDDNLNGIRDLLEPGNVIDEDDLIPVDLKINPPTLAGSVGLMITAWNDKIKIWEDDKKTKEVIPPIVYDSPSEVPKRLWLEGIKTSDSQRDVGLLFDFISFYGNYQDKVKLTVYELDATHMAFNYDETSIATDAINIRKDYTNEVRVPEWIIDDGLHSDMDLDPDRDDPIAYLKNKTNIIVKTRFIVTPKDITNAEIMAETPEGIRTLGNLVGDAFNIWKPVEFQGGVSKGSEINTLQGFVDFTTSKGTADSVNMEVINWQWKVRNVEDNGQSPCQLNASGPCTLYTIPAEPVQESRLLPTQNLVPIR